MITDFYFYLAAVPAVLLYGMGKGGLGGAPGAVAVPLMALATDPVTAATILLPIICLMDLHVVWLYRRNFNSRVLKIIIPAALAGVLIGTALMGTLSPDHIKVLVGLIAVSFCLQYWFFRGRASGILASDGSGYFWGTIAGVTSMHIHAGGPPISVYLLPQKLDKFVLVGTLGIFFAVLNYVKLVPYAYLGQFEASTLLTSLILLPLAPIGVWLGYLLIQRVEPTYIYRVIYVCLFASGAKLLYDGGIGLGVTG